MPTKLDEQEAEARRALQAHTERLNAEKAETERLRAELRVAKITSGARREAIRAGVHPDHLDDAVAIAARQLSLSENGRLVIVDEDGDPKAVSVEQYFTGDFRKGREWMFDSADSSGGRTGADGVASLKDLKTNAEKSAFIKRHGLDAFKSLPRE